MSRVQSVEDSYTTEVPKLSKDNGSVLIELARRSVESVFDGNTISVSDSIKEQFSENNGVFVTIHKFGKLRGCIGYPKSSIPIHETILSAAKSAAFQDPRFRPLNEDELSKVDFEVSILSSPEEIDVKSETDIKSNIKIGKHGLIVKCDDFSSLVLPHVPVEYGWNSKEFLRHALNKAGLNEDAWKEPESTIYTFKAKIFKEE